MQDWSLKLSTFNTQLEDGRFAFNGSLELQGVALGPLVRYGFCMRTFGDYWVCMQIEGNLQESIETFTLTDFIVTDDKLSSLDGSDASIDEGQLAINTDLAIVADGSSIDCEPNFDFPYLMDCNSLIVSFSRSF